MAELNWPSNSEKLEAIGFLAIPGVVRSIEATVPKGKTDQFKEEYKDKYSDEYPYEADKYGRQFRIYLNDTEGCPEFLREHLDGTYGNRINNTEFIDELVKKYGFRFTKDPQYSDIIQGFVRNNHKGIELDAFYKGFHSYRTFVTDIEKLLRDQSILSRPKILKYEKKSISKHTGRKDEVEERHNSSAYTPNQLLRMGWSGEYYIFYLLRIKDKFLLDELSIPVDEDFQIEWFNEGVQNADEMASTNSAFPPPYGFEIKKKWTDKSVGMGCDILVKLDNGDTVCIEVKTSRRSYPYFGMTSIEMQEMEMRKENYFLVKINNFENLLKNESPDIIVIMNPFDKLFHTKQMKDATFIIGGR